MAKWRVTVNGWQRAGSKWTDADRSIWTITATAMHYTKHGDLCFMDAEGQVVRGFARGTWATFVQDDEMSLERLFAEWKMVDPVTGEWRPVDLTRDGDPEVDPNKKPGSTRKVKDPTNA